MLSADAQYARQSPATISAIVPATSQGSTCRGNATYPIATVATITTTRRSHCLGSSACVASELRATGIRSVLSSRPPLSSRPVSAPPKLPVAWLLQVQSIQGTTPASAASAATTVVTTRVLSLKPTRTTSVADSAPT